MPIAFDQQKRAVAVGIWLLSADIVTVWYGLALLYLIGGLVLIGVIRTCEWVFGPEAGGRVGFWIMIVGGILIAAMGQS